jgi:hypothetical protein
VAFKSFRCHADDDKDPEQRIVSHDLKEPAEWSAGFNKDLLQETG